MIGILLAHLLVSAYAPSATSSSAVILRAKREGSELCSLVLTETIDRLRIEKKGESEAVRTIYGFIEDFLSRFQNNMKRKSMGKTPKEQWISFWEDIQVSWETRLDSVPFSSEAQRVLLNAMWNDVGDWMEDVVLQYADIDK